jgi:hypothetical protein
MGECAKQLTDAIAVARAARVPRRTIGRSDPQRRPRIHEAGEFRIFAQAREYAAPGVGNDKLEGAVARGIGDHAAPRAAAVLENVVLQFAQSAHQPAHKSLGQARRDRCVLGMLRPLIPGEPRRLIATGIQLRQREDAGAVMRAGATDRPVPQRPFDLVPGTVTAAIASSTSGPILPDRASAIGPSLGNRPASACQSRSSAASKLALTRRGVLSFKSPPFYSASAAEWVYRVVPTRPT